MFGWLKKKTSIEQINTGLHSAFNRIREDLSSQKEMLESIHKEHHSLKKNTSLNHQRIADWIKHFDASFQSLEKNVGVLEKRLEEKFDSLSNASLKLFQDAYSKNIKDIKQIKSELKEEIKQQLSDEISKSEKPASKEKNNVSNVNNVNNVMCSELDYLSNPEKWLIGVLFNAEQPLSYDQIANKTGKSVNTVRVYMNRLKLRDLVDESSLPNGVKLFGLKHRAKVKKLYNL